MSLGTEKPVTMIIRGFEFSRDFRSIQWRATLKYNMLRAAMCGCVISLFVLFIPLQPSSSRLFGIFMPLFWPIFYLLFVLPLSIAANWFSGIAPAVGLFGQFLSLIGVSLGDPLVCVIKHYYPHVVPVEAPPIFSLTPVFWILDATEISIAS